MRRLAESREANYDESGSSVRTSHRFFPCRSDLRFSFLSLLSLGVLCVAVLTGCGGSKQGLLREIDNDVDRIERQPLCAQLAEISIRDQRSGVSDRPLRVPALSFPTQSDTVRPPLTNRERTIIEEEVRNRVAAGDSSFTVEVTVLEGAKTFNAKTFTESQGAQWTIAVLLSGAGEEARGRGEATYSDNFMDASRGYSGVLYRKVLRYGVVAAFSDAAKSLPETFSTCSR